MKIYEQEAPDTKITEVVCNDNKLCYQPPFESFIVIPESTEELKQIRETVKQLLNPDSGGLPALSSRKQPDKIRKKAIELTSAYGDTQFAHHIAVDILELLSSAPGPELLPDFNCQEQLTFVRKQANRLLAGYDTYTSAYQTADLILKKIDQQFPPFPEYLLIKKSDYDNFQKELKSYSRNICGSTILKFQEFADTCFHKPGDI